MKETLLVIDDNTALRENTAELLELAGYSVITAANGKEGLEMAQRFLPSLILCDIMMPELDGYGVLRTLENIPNLAGTPFIFFTSKSEKGDFRKGMDLGADDYLVKPFTADELLRVVGARIKKNEMLKSKFQETPSQAPQDIEVANLEDLLEGHKIKKYKRRETIFQEEDVPAFFYYVKSGKIKTFKTNDQGKEYITGIFNEGNFFGHASLFDKGIFTESAETLEDSEIVLIPKEDIFRKLNGSKDLALKFIKLISNNLAEAEEKLINLAFNSARKKVADALLYFYEKYKDPMDENAVVSFRVSRENISAIAGVVPESVSRNLSDFRNEKLIETAKGKVTILNLKQLQNMKN
ncbi:MAG: response regulator [Bacteroidetes bacterium]|nr:response regulator [Bacteroidota bacterium]